LVEQYRVFDLPAALEAKFSGVIGRVYFDNATDAGHWVVQLTDLTRRGSCGKCWPRMVYLTRSSKPGRCRRRLSTTLQAPSLAQLETVV